MGGASGKAAIVLACAFLCAGFPSLARAQKFPPFIFPEQRTIRVRHPRELPQAPVPNTPPPPTVARPQVDAPVYNLSLDEAIRVGLANSEVVRVLAGVTAVNSGSTVYDPAISNTAIDQQQGRFDPTVTARNNFNRVETPVADFDPMDITQSIIGGARTDDYDLDFDLSKTTSTGGLLNLGVNTNPSRFQPGLFPLNPQNRSSLDMSFSQPLLQGGGWRANLAPIVLARIDTERSYFQFKDSLQEMVRGVIEAYWAVVFARVAVWVRERQVDQNQFVVDRAEARLRAGIDDIGPVTQARSSLAGFRATLITARADLLQREAALRNILGLPPYDPMQITPTTQPIQQRIEPRWEAVLELAQERRPDIIELKLILEADQQLLLQARNEALPSLDAFMLYRWNGLEGEMPNGVDLSSGPGQFTDWTLGVNFSVPLGLRQARAGLRRQELVIARDRANLQQGLHSASHGLALDMRNLAQFYEQYRAFAQTRTAALANLEFQIARQSSGLADLLLVTTAITDWGNAVISEAQALLQYNSELANLERDTGTILETHAVRFYEERFRAIGPLGRLAHRRDYPESLRPTLNPDQRPASSKPSEDAFNLQIPAYGSSRRQKRLEELPPPTNSPPLNQNNTIPPNLPKNGSQPALRQFIR